MENTNSNMVKIAAALLLCMFYSSPSSSRPVFDLIPEQSSSLGSSPAREGSSCPCPRGGPGLCSLDLALVCRREVKTGRRQEQQEARRARRHHKKRLRQKFLAWLAAEKAKMEEEM